MKKLYLIVFFFLTLFTVLEIFAAEYFSGFLKQSSLVILAFVKAFLVAWYYMHLKDESKLLKFIASMLIFGVILALVVIVEVVIR